MSVADEYQQITSFLFHWQAYEPSVKADLSCCALFIPDGLVFVDPIPLEKGALCELVELAVPRAVVLTNGNHERAAASFKKQFGIPVYAHTQAEGEVTADHWIEEGELFDSVNVISLPGFGLGEIALHVNQGAGALLMGDALINFGEYPFMPLPDKYCTDPKQGRQSLRKLLSCDFELMTFSHGTPIISGAKARLEKLLSH